MPGMKILSIIGAGRVGMSVGRLVHASGYARIGAVCCRSNSHARAAVDFIGAGSPCTLNDLSGLSGLTLLSVSDDAIAGCAEALVPFARPGAVVFHASGVCDHLALAALADVGMATGSLHPAFSFADPARAVAAFAGTWCALEGDEAALATLEPLATAIGGRPFRLAPGGKAAYHAALSIGSNYLVALAAQAQAVAALAGIGPDLANALLDGLMRQTLDNVRSLGPAAALTGPIARGDVSTVARHLAVLADAGARECYVALGRATLELARPGLDAAAVEGLSALFDAAMAVDSPAVSAAASLSGLS
jgi:predicted short-subunit dehydrogenase-like oxidoreductase (DUF2520 family)